MSIEPFSPLVNLLIKAIDLFTNTAVKKLNRRRRQRSVLLANTRMHCHDRLCRVREHADPADAVRLGVYPAATASEMAGGVQLLTSYVRRDVEADLQKLAETENLIIIEGSATSGKTRLAFEFMQEWAPDRDLVVPAAPNSLRTIVRKAAPLNNAIIWLDGLENYLTAGGLDASILDSLCPPGGDDVLILATLRAEAHSQLISSESDAAATRESQEVLKRARIIMLDASLSESEQLRAQLLRHDVRIANALDQGAGAEFGEYLAAGPMTLERWQSSKHSAHSAASAIISAAVDARRAGYRSPLSHVLLEKLYPSYLEPRDQIRTGAADAEDFDGELTWAAEPVTGAIGCLNPAGDDTYEPFSYLVSHVERTSSLRDIPHPLWRALQDQVTETSPNSEDMFHVGTAAYLAGEREISEPLFARAASAGHASAMSNLGFQFHAAGKLDEAKQKYQDAAEKKSASAMANMGFLLHQNCKLEEAKKWFQDGAALGSADAMAGLGFLFHQKRRLTDAEKCYQQAVAAGSIEAKAGLGLLMQDRGLLEEAERWYQQAAEAGSLDAMACLGFLHHMKGQCDKAKYWYERGVQRGSPDAMAGLGFLRHTLGESFAAEHWYEMAAAAGNTITSRAMGNLLHARGDYEKAAQYYKAAYKADDPAAAVLLSILMNETDRPREAGKWDPYAAKAKPEINSYALGLLCHTRGQREEAVLGYKPAAEAGYPLAIAGLVILLQDMGFTDEAERWWKCAMKPKDVSAVGPGMGFLFHRWGPVEGYGDRWSRTVSDGDLVISGLGLSLHQMRQPKKTGQAAPAPLVHQRR